MRLAQFFRFNPPPATGRSWGGLFDLARVDVYSIPICVNIVPNDSNSNSSLMEPSRDGQKVMTAAGIGTPLNLRLPTAENDSKLNLTAPIAHAVASEIGVCNVCTH